MNIANKLTLLRVILVPLFLALLYLDIPLNFLWALIVFSAASLTDMLDGKLARRYGLVTDFGKFLDPLADKILVVAAATAFIGFGLAHPVAVIIIVAREFVVSGIRLVAASSRGDVIAANWWGKAKTTLQIIVITAALSFYELSRIIRSEELMKHTLAASNWGMWAAATFTAVSGAVYLKENWKVFTEGM